MPSQARYKISIERNSSLPSVRVLYRTRYCYLGRSMQYVIAGGKGASTGLAHQEDDAVLSMLLKRQPCYSPVTTKTIASTTTVDLCAIS